MTLEDAKKRAEDLSLSGSIEEILLRYGYYVFTYWVGDGYGDGFWKAQVQGFPSGNKLHETDGGANRLHQRYVGVDWAFDCIEDIVNGTTGGKMGTDTDET